MYMLNDTFMKKILYSFSIIWHTYKYSNKILTLKNIVDYFNVFFLKVANYFLIKLLTIFLSNYFLSKLIVMLIIFGN